MSARRILRRAALALLLGLVASPGCGYQFQGTGNALPPDIQTVAIPIFRNDSDFEGVEIDFTEALIEQFVRGRQVRIVDDPADANAVVKGAVRRVRNRAVSFSETDQALEIQMTVTLSVSLERTRDGKVIWSDAGLTAREEFPVTADAVVTRSSEFIGRTSNFNDATVLGDVQVAQEESAAAIERVSRRAAKTLYQRMIEDF